MLMAIEGFPEAQRRITHFQQNPHRMNLLRALATVSGMTLLSRVLGFARDFVIARTFGAGMVTDAFFVAFKLPNLLRLQLLSMPPDNATSDMKKM